MRLRRVPIVVGERRCAAAPPVVRDVALHAIQHGKRPVVERDQVPNPRRARQPLADLAQAAGRIVRRGVGRIQADAEIAAARAHLGRQLVA